MFQNHLNRNKDAIAHLDVDKIDRWCANIVSYMKFGATVFVGGNGGSASQADHFVGELVGSFRNKKRKGIHAICLGNSLSSITSISNDFEYDYVFERELEALWKKNDIFLGISTSGSSKNIIRALNKCSELGGASFFLTGKNIEDIPIKLPEKTFVLTTYGCDVPSIQEMHLLVLHYLAEKIENEFNS